MKYLIYFGSIIFFAALCFSFGFSDDKSWISDHLLDGDELLCTEKNEHGVLFASGYRDSIRVGILIDVDHGVGRPLPTRSSISIYSTNDNPVMTPKHSVYKREIKVIGGNYYFEHIMGYEVHGDWRNGGRLEVSVSFMDADENIDNLGDSSIPNAINLGCDW